MADLGASAQRTADELQRILAAGSGGGGGGAGGGSDSSGPLARAADLLDTTATVLPWVRVYVEHRLLFKVLGVLALVLMLAGLAFLVRYAVTGK